MTNSEVAIAATAAFENGEQARAESYLAEDFIYQGTFAKSLDRTKYLALMRALKKGFPDFRLNLKIISEDSAGRITATMDPTGTHLGVFDPPGIRPVQPTGQLVALPRHRWYFSFAGGKISQIELEDASQGGLIGLLEQIGVDMSVDLPPEYFGPHK
jgi:hypothetical protein